MSRTQGHNCPREKVFKGGKSKIYALEGKPSTRKQLKRLKSKEARKKSRMLLAQEIEQNRLDLLEAEEERIHNLLRDEEAFYDSL